MHHVPLIALFSANRWRLDVLTFLIKGFVKELEVKNNSTSRFVGFSKLLELFLIPPFFCYYIIKSDIRWFLAVQERIWNCFKMALVSINFKFIILACWFFLKNVSFCIFYKKVFLHFFTEYLLVCTAFTIFPPKRIVFIYIIKVFATNWHSTTVFC